MVKRGKQSLRRLKMKETEKKTCSNCVLHTKIPGVAIDEHTGVCTACASFNRFKPHEPQMRKFLQEEMENLFKRSRQMKNPYDVIVLFSGGKDSTALLKIAKNGYGLRPLALSIMHPLVNNTASKNMEDVARKLGVELLKVYPDEQLYKKTMKEGIENGLKYGLGEFMGCEVCSFYHFWIPIKYAMMMNIPVILEGSDVSQTGEITYWQAERVVKEAQGGKKPFGGVHDIFATVMGESYEGSLYHYDQEMMNSGKYPTVISPFTFMEYDYIKNFREIDQMGLNSKDFRTIYTNCEVQPFFSYFTLNRFDCVSYIKHYASEIRRGYPNLMQHSVKDDDINTSLDKATVNRMMDEYRKVVVHIVDSGLNNQNVTDEIKKEIKKMAPTYMEIFGEAVCDVFLKDALQIPYYAEYFGVDLKKALISQ